MFSPAPSEHQQRFWKGSHIYGWQHVKKWPWTETISPRRLFNSVFRKSSPLGSRFTSWTFLSLSLCNIPNVQPEVQMFSATAPERQPSGGVGTRERRYLSCSQEAPPDKIPAAPLRNVLSWLEGLWGKTFHRWTDLSLSGHVYFLFHILLPGSTRALSVTLLISFYRFIGDLMICFDSLW